MKKTIGVLGSLGVWFALSASPATGQLEGLTVHGYLTQAYATATDHPTVGIPVEGTTDYRALALQFHYGLSAFDGLVVQLSHNAFGVNPTSGYRGEVALDWAFYQRRLGPASARIGRLPIPRGLFNEVRDAGPLLPFYRAPYSFYSESAEAIDGASVTLVAPAVRGLELEGTVYGGSYEFVFSGHDPGGPYVWSADIDGVLGSQLWLTTARDGLRLGLGGQRYAERDDTGTETGDAVSIWQASMEATREWGSVRAEYQEIGSSTWQYLAWYVQAGVPIVGGLSLNAQLEVADMQFDTPAGALQVDFSRDYAIGLTYPARHDLVLKIEAHRADGYAVERYVDLTGPALSTGYLIASIAASF